VYDKKFDDNKNDAVWLEKVCKILDKKECNSSELFFKSTAALHSLQPTPATAYLMAKMCAGKEMYDQVLEYLPNNVIESISNVKSKESAYLLVAQACMTTKKYSQGRAAAYKALEINPSKGTAYILIGNMYAASAPSCGDDAEVGKKAAYWAAVDKFRKAKAVDPSLAETADKLISVYSAYFPARQDIFMAGLAVGNSYTVGCWIQEATTVREK
jgi:tetratricopeptide (TPR) repeat protein